MASKQLMLWHTKVARAGDGQAVVRADTPVLEGGVDQARKALGGFDAVSRYDVYRLIRDGYIRGWKKRPGAARGDGRRSNTKWVVDIGSCLAHRARMEKEACGAVARHAQAECGDLFS